MLRVFLVVSNLECRARMGGESDPVFRNGDTTRTGLAIHRIAAAQTPEFRGNVDGALRHLADVAGQALAAGASLVCFPEGYLQGYLTDERPARECAMDLGSSTFRGLLGRLPESGPMMIFGLIEVDDGCLFNTAVVVHGRALIGRYRKAHLLSRERCFGAGRLTEVFQVNDLRFGINICHDTNFPTAAQDVAALGASLIVCPANNMLPRKAAEKWKYLHNAIRADRCRETGLWLVSADVTGERDGCVSWGPTAVLTPEGVVAAQLPLDRPGLLVFDLPTG
jgi:predicted amidohydrolase